MLPVLEPSPLLIALALVGSAAGALTDWKWGIIPNRLTYPLMVAGPVIYLITRGAEGLFVSIIGMLVAGLIPWGLQYKKGIGGGDVKMFLALGGLLGAYIGLEVEFFAMVAGTVYALGKMAWEGALLRTLSRTLTMVSNPFVPQRYRKTIPAEMLTTFRFGGAIFVGVLFGAMAHANLWIWYLT